ncbi:MAG: DUF120 domain-containing protein, partial [Candidatus Heimdallarchaeaceae archaeon]
LNLRINPSDVDHLELIKGSWPVVIEGFVEESRTFGDVICYPLYIPGREIKLAGIVPRRTHYGTNTLELISDVFLREALKVEDGDEITVEYKLHSQTGDR